MVAKMMRWPRPPPPRNFRVRLVVRRAEGLPPPPAPLSPEGSPEAEAKVFVEVCWKGPKMSPLSSLRRAQRPPRNQTRKEALPAAGAAATPANIEDDDAVAAAAAPAPTMVAVAWEEEFERDAALTAMSHREATTFQPWDVSFSVVSEPNKMSKGKLVLGTASLNLADYASAAEEEIEIILPLSAPSGGATDLAPSLHLTLSLAELKTSPQSPGASQRSVVVAPLSPSSGDSVPSGKDEVSVIKVGLRNLKILRDLVSTRRFKKTNCDGSVEKYYVHSDGAEFSCDTDSLDDDLDDAEQDDDLEGSTVRKSFSYGSLQTMNVGALLYAPRIDGDDEGWIHYSHRNSDANYHVEQVPSSTAEEHASIPVRRKRSILPVRWRKTKMPKAKGEPLLKPYGEEGGDDIDYDRRLLTPSDGSVSEGSNGPNSMASVFGDDDFVVGNWELKEVFSRDGHLKLSTQVFFASIDQRSERAAGESACTALVAVIADWFQANQDLMPIRSQFDNLIREGSLEWRKLCENETYRERFPDKHFDLDTVLHSKIRPLTVVPSKSFIGFFHPEGTEDLSGFEFLHGAMSFDNIWDEISRAVEATGKSTLYIVSWNDHFFVLKVDADAYYIIDTLGERLSEGCNQAYILKFDDSTTIHKVPSEKKEENPESSCLKDSSESSSTEQDSGTDTEECELVLKGKDACKEYIKSFLAAIPIRELQADIKKGLMASTPLHHRLQIEFHYTESCPAEITMPAPFPTFEFCWPEPPSPTPAMEVEVTHLPPMVTHQPPMEVAVTRAVAVV
ncbi:hypothetical protein HU200_008813 [Digitaria exilis]|uniref:C2 NT-type domain-containing protein n=1 Tax=Digitaria exilis TaxID=1010633 RepID=A0A835FL10_9POAL|nr:hypothetical protein HU200_008813 [Digitaria exilis]